MESACAAGAPIIVRCLLSKGARVDVHGKKGKELVYWAFANVDLVNYLHMEANAPLVDERGYSILMQRIADFEDEETGHDAVDLILAKNAEDEDGSRNVALLLGSAETRCKTDNSTIWHVALKHCRWDLVGCFLYNEAAFPLCNEPNDLGDTPLHCAMRHQAPINLCENLVEIGEAKILARNHAGKTCLDIAKDMAEESEGNVYRYVALSKLHAEKLWGLTKALCSLEGYVEGLLEHHLGNT